MVLYKNQGVVLQVRIENGVLLEVDGTEHEIVLPNDVTVIAQGVFENNRNIEVLSFADHKIHKVDIMSRAFKDSSIIFADIVPLSVGVQAFSGCIALIPPTAFFSELEEIERSAFSFTSIKRVELPKCESIGAYAFSDCFNLEQFHAPHIQQMGKGVLSGCISLNQVELSYTDTLPQELSDTAIEKLTVHINNIETIQSFIKDMLFVKELIIISNGNTRIGKGAIVNCPNLLKVRYTSNISFDVDSIDEPDDIDLSILEGVFLV